jgi:hypothetical protein
MTLQEQIQALAKRQRVGVFFDNRARRDGSPWIIFKKNGMCLGAFHDETDALAWFPARAGTEGKP